MPTLHVRFLTGRYHAARWGTHVNEAEIEWPPSPWRLYRAFIATGFSRLGWVEPPAVARSLLARLASSLPAYRLPAGTAAHTRHYMPLFKGNTTKVIDAFLHIGRYEDAVLRVHWPVDLPPEEERVLAALAGALPYLGRAESWVEARIDLASPDAAEGWCRAATEAPSPSATPIRLLAPVEPRRYSDWRQRRLREHLATALEEAQRRAADAGRRIPAKLPNRKRDRLLGLYPKTWLDALMRSTGQLHKQGWSRPPGSREVTWWRTAGTEPRPRSPRRKTHSSATAALLALTPDTRQARTLPRLSNVLRHAELLHRALVKGSQGAPVFTGATPSCRSDHSHASLLFLSLESKPTPRNKVPWRRLDHVLIWAPMGMNVSATAAVRGMRRLWSGDEGLPDVFTACIGVGEPSDFIDLVPDVRSASIWESATPYVAPRFLKARGRNGLVGQVRAELETRGVPGAEEVDIQIEIEHRGQTAWAHQAEWAALRESVVARSRVVVGAAGAGSLDRLAPWWRHVHLHRQFGRIGPPQALALGLRLLFPEPVPGPISLGYGSHFGLGRFVPANAWTP